MPWSLGVDADVSPTLTDWRHGITSHSLRCMCVHDALSLHSLCARCTQFALICVHDALSLHTFVCTMHSGYTHDLVACVDYALNGLLSLMSDHVPPAVEDGFDHLYYERQWVALDSFFCVSLVTLARPSWMTETMKGSANKRTEITLNVVGLTINEQRVLNTSVQRTCFGWSV
jgi:hypothetical protein